MAWWVPDFETASACDLKEAGADRYAEDPTTEVLCLSFCDQNDSPAFTWFPGQPPIPAIVEAIIRGDLFVAHSARFERAMWQKHMVEIHGWPPIPLKQWHDTQARCANLVLPLDLEKAAKVLNLPAEKDMEGRRITLSLSKPNRKGYYPPRTPELMARVGQYCEGDVYTQRALHKRIGWLPPEERQVWLLDQRINDRGVRLDLDLVDKMQKIVDEASAPLAAEFADLTGGLKMTQVAKVTEWVKERGVHLPNMQKDTLAKLLGETEDGEEYDDEAEDGPDQIDLPADVHRALHIRQLIGSASIKKLRRMRACVGSDGRARGLLQYHGAGPGRWSGRLIQPQNFPRGAARLKDVAPEALVEALMTGDWEYVQALYGPAVEVVVSSLRHTIIPDPGRTLVAGDFAQIEARITLAVAGQWDKVALLASGADVYCDMASDIYERKITKADPDERQIGKNSVLGLGFNMGAPKFHWKYCPDQPLEFAQRVVKTYREEWAPEVPKLWKALERAACDTVWYRTPHEAYGVIYAIEDDWLTALLPSGRKLWYYNPRPVRRAMPWDETDVRRAWTYQTRKMGRWVTVDAFGGLLTENVAQGLARDLLVHSMKTCEREGYPICFTVHDELISEPLVERADETALKQMMEDIPAWAKGLRIPVVSEVWKGDRYRK